MTREQAIEIIRKNMPSDKSLPVYEAIQTLIPELAESEDESIRKWLLAYAIEMIAGLESDISLSTYDGIKGHDPEAEAELAQWQKARAYLEKQKEQKPVEWSEDYREEDIQTRFAFYTYKDDPSVLYLSNVFVEETSRNHGFGTRILKAAEKAAEAIGAITVCLKVKQDSPANAWYRKRGYGYVTFEDGYDWLEKNLEYLKPKKEVEWSDTKELVFKDICKHLKEEGYNGWVTLLEALHSGEFKQPVSEWSEEDEDMFVSVLHFLNTNRINERGKIITWVESLPKRFSLQPKPEWSEEDEKMLENIRYALRYAYSNSVIDEQITKYAMDLLKSLRPSWKPSKDQMEALKCTLADITRFSKRGGRQVELENEPYYSALHSLYCNLEKLI